MENRTARVTAISADIERDLREQIVAEANGIGLSRGELHEAFKRVENPRNWKAPIDAKFTTVQEPSASLHEVAVIREAVIFFTGSEPTITHEGNFRFRCRAPGYFATVGA